MNKVKLKEFTVHAELVSYYSRTVRAETKEEAIAMVTDYDKRSANLDDPEWSADSGHFFEVIDAE